MATPTPRPAKLKLLNGVSPGRDSGGRLVKPPPNFERGCPEPPADLGAEALAEWERITSGLDRLNLLKSEDYAVLLQHCQTWQTYITAIRQVRAEGVTVLNPKTGFGAECCGNRWRTVACIVPRVRVDAEQ